MIDLFNLSGTFIRKTKKYFVRSESNNDGTFLEEVSETLLNSEGVYESKVSTGLSVLDCSHIIRHHTEIGCKCPYCGNLNCLQHCTHVCERCLTTVGNCCTKTFEEHLVCVHCYRVLRAKQAALLAGKALLGTTKILLIPFKK
jgi:hypothetical protein